MIEKWLFWDNATYMKQIGIGNKKNNKEGRV